MQQRIKFGPSSGEIALGYGSVWVNIYEGRNQGDVARIDPCSGSVEFIRVGKIANSVISAYGSIWMTDSAERAVHRIDPETGEVTDIDLPEIDPQDLEAGEGYVWIAHYGPKRVTRIDPDSNSVLDPAIEIGPGAAGIDIGGGTVWIANYEGDSVSTIDVESLKSDPDAARVGRSPTDVALGWGRVWVADNDAEPPSVTPITP